MVGLPVPKSNDCRNRVRIISCLWVRKSYQNCPRLHPSGVRAHKRERLESWMRPGTTKVIYEMRLPSVLLHLNYRSITTVERKTSTKCIAFFLKKGCPFIFSRFHPLLFLHDPNLVKWAFCASFPGRLVTLILMVVFITKCTSSHLQYH